MKNRKNNSEFSWFIVGFILTNVLLYSTSKLSDSISGASDLSSTDYNKYAYIENRQNSYARPKSKMPSYRLNYSTNFGSTYRSTVHSQISENETFITADYKVNLGSKRDVGVNKSHNVGYSAGNYGASNYTQYSNNKNNSSYRNENSSNSVNYSELSQSINQLASITKGSFVAPTENPNASTRSDYGFLSMKTDLTAIGASLSMNENVMQRATNDDINPGGGEEMGDPIPVGDGWVFMLLLAVGYVGYKRLRV